MQVAYAIATIALVGCGRIGFDALGDPPSTDAGDLPPCTTGFGAFGAPTNLTELNSTANDLGPTVNVHENAIFFDSARAGGAGNRDIWRSERMDRTMPWGTPMVVGILDTNTADENPGLGAHDLHIVFDSGRLNDDDLYESKRDTITAGFGMPTRLELSQVGKDELAPSLSTDGLTLFYSIVDLPPAANTNDLAVASRPELTTKFTFVRMLTEINLAGVEDKSPSISADGNELFFESDRSGSSRIYVSLLNGTTFGVPREVVELTMAGTQSQAPVLSADGRTIYFASDRPGGLGGADLWMAQRTCQ